MISRVELLKEIGRSSIIIVRPFHFWLGDTENKDWFNAGDAIGMQMSQLEANSSTVMFGH